MGQGTIDIGSCDGDGAVTFEIKTFYRGDDFVLDGVRILGVDADCIGSTLSLFFKIKETGTLALQSAGYSIGDLMTCNLELSSAIRTGSGDANSFSMPASTSCARENSARVAQASILMSSIGTRDLNGLIGFEIAPE